MRGFLNAHHAVFQLGRSAFFFAQCSKQRIKVRHVFIDEGDFSDQKYMAAFFTADMSARIFVAEFKMVAAFFAFKF